MTLAAHLVKLQCIFTVTFPFWTPNVLQTPERFWKDSESFMKDAFTDFQSEHQSMGNFGGCQDLLELNNIVNDFNGNINKKSLGILDN